MMITTTTTTKTRRSRRRCSSATMGMQLLSLAFALLCSTILFSSTCNAKISDQRLCYDKDCSVVVSLGKTTVPYNSKDHDVLSFPQNTEAKIYSRAAGSRKDLLGVEINGKRGYAPARFIREYKIIHGGTLEHLVSTEELSKEQVKDANQEAEKVVAPSSNNASDNVQNHVIQKDVPISESANENFKETIKPDEVTNAYVYDGTVIPEDFADIQAPQLNYSSRTLLSAVEKEEEEEDGVKLGVYPYLIKSTFSALSGILGSGDESAEDGSVEVLASESSVNEETTVKTPEIEKTDESSQSTEEQQTAIPEKTLVQNAEFKETELENTLSQETVSEEVMCDETVSEKPVEPKEESQDTATPETAPQEELPKETITLEPVKQQPVVQDVLPQESAVPAVPEMQETSQEKLAKETAVPEVVSEEVVPEKTLPIETSGQEKNSEEKQPETITEQAIPEKPALQESVQQNPLPSVTETPKEDEVQSNVIKSETDSVVKNKVHESANQSVTTEQNPNSENVIADNTSSEDTSSNKGFFINVQEEVKPASDNLVPKEETVAINDNLVNIENETGVETPVKQLVSEKHTVEEQETFVNLPNVEEPITSQVPLNEQTTSAPSVSFIPNEEQLQQDVSNDSVPLENKIDLNVNETTTDEFTLEQSNPTNDILNLEEKSQVDDVAEDTNNVMNSYTTSVPTYSHNDSATENSDFQSADSSHESIVDVPSTPSFGEFLGNRNLLNAEDYSEEIVVDQVVTDEKIHTTTSSGVNDNLSNVVESKEEQFVYEESSAESNIQKLVIPAETCDSNFECSIDHEKMKYSAEENAVTGVRKMADNSETLLYVCITAVTTLLFSLGYYFIENRRRDAYLIAKINNLEKDLMITRKECIMLDENFKSTKTKLDSIEDESFGSNEMVLSLKGELTASESTRAELEDQISSLEKELESTSEAGLELERMLREILSTQSEENNPLAQSIEDLQERLNNQQVANESLQNALAIKTTENESLSSDLAESLKKAEQFQAELKKMSAELRTVTSAKINLEQTLQDQVQVLEIQIKSMTDDNSHLRKQVRMKELEVKELLGVIEQINSNNIDYEKIYEVSQIKAEATHLFEEREELKSKLHEEEGAHQLLEEHVKLVKEEVAFLSEQCRVAEKEKKDAETRLEVLTKFFEEKEAQRQKEEAIWLEKQGEVSSTVERLQTMQNDIVQYKKQIEMLKNEIVNQEDDYKSKIAALEKKSDEHWIAVRAYERRLEEVKAESSQLRNRLTIAEKNMSEMDPEVKLHRLRQLGQNGETCPEGGGASALNHQLFPGGETSSSPLIFGGGVTGPVPPLPPPPHLGSYHPHHHHPHHHMFPPLPLPGFMPPPPPPTGSSNSSELVGSRPPPLGGGRLPSPPPSHNPAASPPPLSPPPVLMPFPPPPHHHHHPTHHPHPMHPPLPPYASDHVPPSPMMLQRHHLRSMPPPTSSSQQQQQQQERGGHTHNSNWGDDNAVRNTPAGYGTQQQQQRAKNHKGSLHSSGESLDKSHHGGKV